MKNTIIATLMLALLAGCASKDFARRRISKDLLTADVRAAGRALMKERGQPSCRFYLVNVDLIRAVYGDDVDVKSFFFAGAHGIQDSWQSAAENRILLHVGTATQLDWLEDKLGMPSEWIRRIPGEEVNAQQ
ncbi:MAG: hypothetical protein EOM12_19245 [Verrucomicrobiae bacterium]|nr:hypothetical protein [Verrucomicrobiae bacterium]